MSGKDRQVLEKIIKHIERILKYSHGFESLEDFQKDAMCVDGCVFNLMQIGELTKVGLSDEIKKEIKTVPWKQLYGMRNRITHDYEGVNMQIVWDTMREDLPVLLTEMKTFLKESETK